MEKIYNFIKKIIFTPQINKNQKLMLFNTAWGRKLGAHNPLRKHFTLRKQSQIQTLHAQRHSL